MSRGMALRLRSSFAFYVLMFAFSKLRYAFVTAVALGITVQTGPSRLIVQVYEPAGSSSGTKCCYDSFVLLLSLLIIFETSILYSVLSSLSSYFFVFPHFIFIILLLRLIFILILFPLLSSIILVFRVSAKFRNCETYHPIRL